MSERDPTNPFAPREYPQITHAEGCWEWGRGHYDCAMEEIKRLRERAEAAESKLASIETCGCSWDAAGDVCEHHSPKLAAAIERAERAEMERDAIGRQLATVKAAYHGKFARSEP